MSMDMDFSGAPSTGTPWCECKNMFKEGFTALTGAGEAKDGDEAWVCGGCRKPSPAIYDAYLEDCDECGGSFSAPWEEICKQCTYSVQHRDTYYPRALDVPYRDWAWANVEDSAYLAELFRQSS